MDIYADRQRHLVAVPYTRDNLMAAADALAIPRHWFHNDEEHAHIDIPVRQLDRILADPRVTVVNHRIVLAITKGHRP